MKEQMQYREVGHIPGRLWEYAPQMLEDWDLHWLNAVIENFNRRTAFWRDVRWLTEKPQGIVTFYLILLFLSFVLYFYETRKQHPPHVAPLRFEPKRILKMLLCFALLMGFSELLCNSVLKPLIGKMKPGTVRYVTGSKPALSFPSSHAFNTACFFATLCAGTHKLGYRHWMLIGVAGLLISLGVGFSRLVLQVHYPSDVVAGLFVGGTIGYSLAPMWTKFWKTSVRSVRKTGPHSRR